MQSESSTSAKRKRRDSFQSEPTPVVCRSEKFWFDDGNVVLQVESMQFRIHRSILVSYSPVFGDLFQVPQPQSDESDWVDGCPIVCMFGDTSEDWDSVLSFVYKPSSLELKWPDVRKLAGMMRLGKKYQLDDIFEEAVKRLKAQFPENLTIHDSMADTSGGFFQWIDTYFPYISRLAEEMALWSILPLTYYTAASRGDTLPNFLLRYRTLSPNTMKSVLYGSSTMWQDIIDCSFKWVKPDETIIPTRLCSSKEKCIATRTLCLAKVLNIIGSQDVCIALDPWVALGVRVNSGFCPPCRTAALNTCLNGKEYIWINLGKYFLGDDWENLEDTKSEIWPSIWEPR